MGDTEDEDNGLEARMGDGLLPLLYLADILVWCVCGFTALYSSTLQLTE